MLASQPPNKGMKLTKSGKLRSFAADMERPLSSLGKRVVGVLFPSMRSLPSSSLGAVVGGEGRTRSGRIYCFATAESPLFADGFEAGP